MEQKQDHLKVESCLNLFWECFDRGTERFKWVRGIPAMLHDKAINADDAGFTTWMLEKKEKLQKGIKNTL